MSEWQPIETAPLNIRIKVGKQRNGRVLSSHCDYAWIEEDGTWWGRYAGEPKDWALTFTPTHWMPLSERPGSY